MKETIYIVVRSVGSFEGCFDYNVCAYLNKDSALTHVENAQKRADEIKKEAKNILDFRQRQSLLKTNQFDPEMDEWDVYYELQELELNYE